MIVTSVSYTHLRIGRVHTVHIRINLAQVRAQRRCDRNRSRIPVSYTHLIFLFAALAYRFIGYGNRLWMIVGKYFSRNGVAGPQSFGASPQRQHRFHRGLPALSCQANRADRNR